MPIKKNVKKHIDRSYWFVHACFFLVSTLMCGNWFYSRMRLIAVISALGLFVFWSKIKPNANYFILCLFFLVLHVPVLISVVLNGEYGAIIYHFGLITTVFPFVCYYFYKFGFTNVFLLSLYILVLPSLLPKIFAGHSMYAMNIYEVFYNEGRFVGASGDPNYTSLFLIAPFVSSLFLKSKNKFLHFFYPTSSLFIFFAIVATGSRAGIGSAMIGFVMYCFFVNKKIKGIFPYLILGVFFFFLFDKLIMHYFDFYIYRTGGSLSGFFKDTRYTMWQSAFYMIMNNPMINNVDQDIFIGIYGRVVHNFILSIGLNFGSLAMFIHFFVLSIGLGVIFFKSRILLNKNIHNFENVYLFIGVLCISVLLIAGTLTVGTSTLYWFIYTLVLSVVFLRVEKVYEQNKPHRSKNMRG